MALRKKLCKSFNFNGKIMYSCARYYSSKMDLRKLKPMIQKRIQNRAKGYPVPAMVPVAQEVLDSQSLVMQGVSTPLKMIPVLACKFCPEVYIGGKGHLIQTTCGFKHRGKNRVHEWIVGGLKDVLVPVEAFHLKHMFQDIIKHHQIFDFERVEKFRDGVEKLLMVYPAKVCKHCSEVHIGPSGHKARLCGVFKYESWLGTHFWRKANVDDLVPPKTMAAAASRSSSTFE